MLIPTRRTAWALALLSCGLLLAGCGKRESFDELIRKLEARDETTADRADAAYQLGELKDRRAVDPLLDVLKEDKDEKDWPVRSAACGALGKLRDAKAVPDLLAALQSDASWVVREHAALALGKLKAAGVVEALVAALKQADPEIRAAVAEALGRQGGDRARGTLAELLSRDVPAVRVAAARALAATKDAGAADLLLAALNDENHHVRAAAAAGLGKLKHADALPRLAALLDDEDLSVRKAAVGALQALGGPQAVEALAKRLADWHLGPDVAKALKALGWTDSSNAEGVWVAVAQRDRDLLKDKWGTARSVLAPATAFEDERTALCAVYALIGIGTDEALGVLEGLLTEDTGTPAIAGAFIVSRNEPLAKAAKTWLEKHGAPDGVPRGAGVRWGGMTPPEAP